MFQFNALAFFWSMCLVCQLSTPLASDNVQTVLLDDGSVSKTFLWSFDTDGTIMQALDTVPGTWLSSKDYQWILEIDGEPVETVWYMEVWPNGESIDTEGDFMLDMWLSKMPVSSSIRIHSIRIQKSTAIPEIGFRITSDAVDYDAEHLGWSWGSGTLNITRFDEFDVVNTGGFQLFVTLELQGITYEKVTNSAAVRSVDPIQTKNDNCAGLHRIEEKLDTLLTALVPQERQEDGFAVNLRDELEADLAQCTAGAAGCNRDDKTDKGDAGDAGDALHKRDATANLERWIATVFGDDTELAKNYIDIIVNQQGFDDLKMFALLNENDLKEMGIEKKGHRVKLMQRMHEFVSTTAVDQAQIVDSM